MIQIAGNGEEIIRVAMHEYDTAEGEEKLIYAERMRAKVEAVIEMSRIPDMIDIDTLRKHLDPAYIQAGKMPDKPEPAKEPETHPMSPEDINNVDVVVKKAKTKKTAEENEKTKQLNQVKKLMKAGKSAGEIAKATGRNQEDILADMNWWRGQDSK